MNLCCCCRSPFLRHGARASGGDGGSQERTEKGSEWSTELHLFYSPFELVVVFVIVVVAQFSGGLRQLRTLKPSEEGTLLL